MLLINYAHKLCAKLGVSYHQEVAKVSCPDKSISVNKLAPYWIDLTWVFMQAGGPGAKKDGRYPYWTYIILLWFEWSQILISISVQRLLHKFPESCDIDHIAHLCAIVKIASKVAFQSRKMSGRHWTLLYTYQCILQDLWLYI